MKNDKLQPEHVLVEKMVPGMHCGGKNVSGNRAAGTHSKQIIGSHWNIATKEVRHTLGLHANINVKTWRQYSKSCVLEKLISVVLPFMELS